MTRITHTHIDYSYHPRIGFAQSEIVPFHCFADHLVLTFSGVKLRKDLHRVVLVPFQVGFDKFSPCDKLKAN